VHGARFVPAVEDQPGRLIDHLLEGDLRVFRGQFKLEREGL
jgi:hypothetical protein